MPRKRKKTPPEVVGFLGVGLDNKDEHRRFTQTEHFFIFGGSHETHERMQDLAVRFDEGLEKRGKRLHEATLTEILELFHEARKRE